MRMSHIYQPIMISFLLEKGGVASAREIAVQLLQHDPSQIEYYEAITKNMVGAVLGRHQIVQKEGNQFRLLNFDLLTNDEIDELKHLCHIKLDEYIQKRGERIWEHRRKNRGYVPGSIKYKVLKRAQGRCELCGISNLEKRWRLIISYQST